MEFTVSQLKYILALGALSEAGDVRIVDIARTLNIQRSSVFNMLNKLANAGIIEKKEESDKNTFARKTAGSPSE